MKQSLIATAVAVLMLTGCTGLKQTESIASKVRVVAYIGTAEILQEKPHWRAGFVLAADELRVLEQAEELNAALILSVVHRMPVNELQSPRAALYFTAGALLLDDALLSIDLTELKELRPIVTALREGIELGLNQ